MKLESAPRWSGRRWFALGLVLATACGDDPGGGGERRPTGPPVTLPLAEQALDDPDVTTVATDLAPSQTGGSTVPDPPTPEPCGVDDVEMWTAQVARDGSSAVVRMRNVSDRWCEPDIGRSPLLDPAIEPDVWLLPDATADLVVGPSTSGCADPAVVDAVQVGIGDESVLVPTALVTCGWWFTAFAPTADVRVGCELADIDVAVTAVSVVVRNASARPCALSGPVGVDGAAVTASSADDPRVNELFAGDVVSLGRPGDVDCDGAHERVVIHDEAFGELEVANVPCEVVFELGAPRPWFGTEVGPLATLTDDATAATVVDALDPFDPDA